jgi:putative lipase involved disintegration of autophagic bodies
MFISSSESVNILGVQNYHSTYNRLQLDKMFILFSVCTQRVIYWASCYIKMFALDAVVSSQQLSSSSPWGQSLKESQIHEAEIHIPDLHRKAGLAPFSVGGHSVS